MLRSNSKIAKQNLLDYIRTHSADYLSDNYGIDPAEIESKADLFRTIYGIFRDEMNPANGYYSRYPEYVAFKDWASGLAMGSLFCYFYNRPARADLAEILEETPAEAEKYTEEQAEEMLTRLLYRELTSVIR